MCLPQEMELTLVSNYFDVILLRFYWPPRENYIIYIKLNIKFNTIGRDAKKTVIMKEDSEMEDGRSSLKEDIARKYSTYFLSLLHHNNGYFIQVRSQYWISITTSHLVCVVWVSEPLCRHSQYLPDRLLTRRQVCQVVYCKCVRFCLISDCQVWNPGYEVPELWPGDKAEHA